MADWERATALAGGPPLLAAGDATALMSARVWGAVEQERLARAAVRSRELEARRARASARVQARRADATRDAAIGVARHFDSLADGHRAVEDALRPMPKDATLWADPAVHEQLASFMRSLRATCEGAVDKDGDLDWAARLQHDPVVIAAHADEAARAYEALKHDMDTVCRARDLMAEIDAKYEC